MYIIKNALRNIVRYKSRNVLIGIIVLVIAVSACIALSIKESAVKVKEDTLSYTTITAQISINRDKIMKIFRMLADEGKCVIIVTHSKDVAKQSDVTYEIVKK